jgi:hypothetical protein
MKTNIILAIALSIVLISLATHSIAQNTIPESGYVGIGTTEPSSNLEVVGETKLQSVIVKDTAKFERPVIVKDSVTIERKLKVEEDVRILGKTVLVDNVRAKSNLVVEGNTNMQGNARVHGNLRLLNLADSALNEDRFLMIRPNGLVREYDNEQFKGLITALAYSTDCKLDENGINSLTHPTWQSGPSILFTGATCPAKVGIGVSNPSHALHVVGSGRFTGDIGIGTTPNVTSRVSVSQNAPNRNGIVVEHTNQTANGTGVGVQIKMNNPDRKALVITEGAQDVFRVYADGKVYATEVHVRLKAEFPDYVFAEEYELMTLEELKAYIEANGKLPGLPSAEEVKEEGVDLGEMNRLLVEKIEQLTLYILELQKQIDALNAK